MSVSNAPLEASKDARQELLRAQDMLRQALAIVDEFSDAAELGARLQECLDVIESKLQR